ncbi:hypothetical protein AHiyo4_46620 [Arthrobacter sp. Hiyo4]|nr:hypothetical protein AHiyo4_46620 [Arthrobacter sp. Hiyo4]
MSRSTQQGTPAGSRLPTPGRRQFLQIAAAGGAAVVLSAAPGTAWAAPPLDGPEATCWWWTAAGRMRLRPR